MLFYGALLVIMMLVRPQELVSANALSKGLHLVDIGKKGRDEDDDA